MGYRRKSYRLTWPEGHELHGLEVSMRGAAIADINAVVSAGGSEGGDGAAVLEAVKALAPMLASKIISWNYEDEDGAPVATDAATLADQDMRVIMQIIQAWKSIVTDVPPASPGTSNSGERFREADLPMDLSSLVP